MAETVASLSARSFCTQIADPDQFSGGGAVAALTAASAAATALLVIRLADRRKRDQVDGSRSPSAALEALIERFFEHADADLRVLDELLKAQRQMKTDGERSAYAGALHAAALAPLDFADDIVVLLDLINDGLPGATRFTVSDLGAAALLAQGAGGSALLTARVNVALLRKETSGSQHADELALRVQQLSGAIAARGTAIVTASEARIDGHTLVTEARP